LEIIIISTKDLVSGQFALNETKHYRIDLTNYSITIASSVVCQDT